MPHQYRVLVAIWALFTWQIASSAATSFTTFESGQVRPLAMSPDGKRLYAVNTPDGYLEVFDIKADGLVHKATVPVGMEPVAVAVRSVDSNNDDVWVVNHFPIVSALSLSM